MKGPRNCLEEGRERHPRLKTKPFSLSLSSLPSSLSLFLSLALLVCLSLCLSVYQSACMSVCLSCFLSACPSLSHLRQGQGRTRRGGRTVLNRSSKFTDFSISCTASTQIGQASPDSGPDVQTKVLEPLKGVLHSLGKRRGNKIKHSKEFCLEAKAAIGP